MSIKNRKQELKGSTLKYIAVVVIGLMLIVAAIFTIRSSNPGKVSGGAPAVSVDQKVIDFGDLKDYPEVTFTITVTNTGTGVLRFKEKPYIQVLEGCCPPELTIGTMALEPGKSTTITSTQFMMHPGIDGKHNYAVHLVTNDPAQPDMVVNVLSNWSQ
ncbi:MAG: hypothetical protein Q8N46_02330 [Anaerolineales bacterium]|nr:hypothetical protein [Anaerolineales bacterium]